MSSSGLWRDIKANPIALGISVLLHIAIFVMLGINLVSSMPHRPASSSKNIVKAVVVDARKVEFELNKIKLAEKKEEKKKRDKQKQLKRESEKARKEIEKEKKRLVAIKKKQDTEKKRLAELERKQEQAEKQRKVMESEARKRAEEAELKRKLAEEERREEEARKQAEETKRLAERNDMLKSLRAQYVKLIEQKVERNWLRPSTVIAGQSCEVYVTQTVLGDVINVNLQRCAKDKIFQRSVERAVRKASPLPPPPTPEVFDREIHFTFKPR